MRPVPLAAAPHRRGGSQGSPPADCGALAAMARTAAFDGSGDLAVTGGSRRPLTITADRLDRGSAADCGDARCVNVLTNAPSARLLRHSILPCGAARGLRFACCESVRCADCLRARDGLVANRLCSRGGVWVPEPRRPQNLEAHDCSHEEADEAPEHSRDHGHHLSMSCAMPLAT